MELKRDLIIKALECCKSPKLTKCDGCPREKEDGHCMYRLNEDALSLIKELTEQVEKDNKTIIDLYHEAETYLAQRDCLRNQVKNLTEENEKIGIENFELVCELSRIKDSTVRKMQERLTKEFNRMHITNFITVEVRQWIIDQIAKEMLEGKE